MAKLQWVIVGVMRTVTVLSGESGILGKAGLMAISGRDTTAKEPKEIGCSGSDIVEMRSNVVELVCLGNYQIRANTRER